MGLLSSVLRFVTEKYKYCLMPFYVVVYLAEKYDILRHTTGEYTSFQSDLLNCFRITE
jgi:hypothetical protein